MLRMKNSMREATREKSLGGKRFGLSASYDSSGPASTPKRIELILLGRQRVQCTTVVACGSNICCKVCMVLNKR